MPGPLTPSAAAAGGSTFPEETGSGAAPPAGTSGKSARAGLVFSTVVVGGATARTWPNHCGSRPYCAAMLCGVGNIRRQFHAVRRELRGRVGAALGAGMIRAPAAPSAKWSRRQPMPQAWLGARRKGRLDGWVQSCGGASSAEICPGRRQNSSTSRNAKN